MIRVSEGAKELLGTLWSPDGEVLRLTRSPGADGAGGLAFRHGSGQGSDQIVQHAGTQVLRIDPSVREGGFDGSSVEVVEGTLGVVEPGPDPHTALPAFHFGGRQK
jgi:hypothetical protein